MILLHCAVVKVVEFKESFRGPFSIVRGERMEDFVRKTITFVLLDSFAISCDGKWIAVSDKWTIRIWDAKTGSPVEGTLQRDESEVMPVALSPDGTCIVSGSEDKKSRIWNAKTGDLVGRPLQGHSGRIMSVAFSPN